jgi:hypothetical protein
MQAWNDNRKNDKRNKFCVAPGRGKVTTEREVDVCEEFVATPNLYRDVKAVVSTWCRRLGIYRLHLYLLAPS